MDDFDNLTGRAVDLLAERFREGSNRHVTGHELANALGVDRKLGYALLTRLRGLGAIEQVESPNSGLVGGSIGGVSLSHEIGPQILEEQEQWHHPRDRVSDAQSWMRSHPVLSLLFIALVVLTFVATLLNQTIELIDKFAPAN